MNIFDVCAVQSSMLLLATPHRSCSQLTGKTHRPVLEGRMNSIFGVNESAASCALAKALWSFGLHGKVFTGCASCAADYRKTHGVWALHNTAWWSYGGAHNVVRAAADILSAEVGCSGADANAAVWEVAITSHNAWRQYQANRRIDRGAREAGLTVPVFRIVRGSGGFGGLDQDFASGFVERFGGEIALAVVRSFPKAVFRLRCEGEWLNDYPCVKPYRSPDCGEYFVSDGHTLSEFGLQYLSSLFLTERQVVCDSETRKLRFDVFGLQELSEFLDEDRIDKIIDALEALLKYYGLERPIAYVYDG